MAHRDLDIREPNDLLTAPGVWCACCAVVVERPRWLMWWPRENGTIVTVLCSACGLKTEIDGRWPIPEAIMDFWFFAHQDEPDDPYGLFEGVEFPGKA